MHKLMLLTSLLAIVLQTFSLPFLAYRLERNRESEAIPMCVNRDQPALACFGSCYINRHLTSAMSQDKAENDATIFTNLQAQPLISPSCFSLQTSLAFPATHEDCFSLISWTPTLGVNAIWDPPRV